MGKHKHDHKKSRKDRKAESTTSESEVTEEVSELSSESESSTYSGKPMRTVFHGRFFCGEEAVQEEEQVLERQ